MRMMNSHPHRYATLDHYFSMLRDDNHSWLFCSLSSGWVCHRASILEHGDSTACDLVSWSGGATTNHSPKTIWAT